jgi:cell division protein FtsB
MNLLPRSAAHRRRHVLRRRPSSASVPAGFDGRRRRLAHLSFPPSSTARLGVRGLSFLKLSFLRLSSWLSSWRRREPGPRSVERRRARALVLAAVVFAAVVLLSALPWSTLMDQHAQLSSAAAQVTALQAQNRALAVEERELSNATTVAGLARQDYGLVEPGQKAYDILPPPGTTDPTAVTAGHVPLDEPPVMPGSALSEKLLGAGPAGATPSGARGRTSADPRDSGGFWSRVGHTLEFWN